MRKVIGVMPLYDAEKKSYWIQPGPAARHEMKWSNIF